MCLKESFGEGKGPLSSVLLLVIKVWGKMGEVFWGAGWVRVQTGWNKDQFLTQKDTLIGSSRLKMCKDKCAGFGF